MTTERFSRHTRVAFADESAYNVRRFRSLAIVTAAKAQVDELAEAVSNLLASSNVRELKWSELNGARQRFAAEKVLAWAVDAVADRSITLDALVWDTHDTRHRVVGRDDVANLHRMYPASSRPSRRPSLKRRRHRRTVRRLHPKRSAMTSLATPSAASSTIFARST
jgi:hypothetical protein